MLARLAKRKEEKRPQEAECEPRITAASRVLQIPELLEMIFENLTVEDFMIRDLLIQQRVNKTWQAVIEKLASSQRPWYGGSITVSLMGWHPFLTTPVYSSCGILTDGGHHSCFIDLLTRTLEPLLRVSPKSPPEAWWRKVSGQQLVSSLKMGWRVPKGFYHPRASWRKQLVHRWGATHLVVLGGSPGEDRRYFKLLAVLDDEKGVKLGDVMDQLARNRHLDQTLKIPFDRSDEV